jgi:hypothetical protein
MALNYNGAKHSYSDRTVLSCKQCGFARVADDYHEAKDCAQLHVKLSKHYDFQLTVRESVPFGNFAKH